jgi:hypothetical protein
LRANENNLPDKAILDSNSMMRKFTALLIVSLLLKVCVAQYSLGFAERVNADGKPVNNSSTFKLNGGGVTINLFVTADGNFGTDEIKFTIYYINGLGNEEDILSLSQKIEPAWNYTWKEITLFDPGAYRVKVYTAKGTYLTSANLIVKKT